MQTALYTCVSLWTGSSPNSGTAGAAITTCSTEKPVATASISKFRSTKLCTQSWQSDGGTGSCPSPSSIPLQRNNWGQWRQPTYSSCSPSSTTHTLHPTCADHCVSYTDRAKAKQQDSEAFGQKSDGKGYHQGCKTSTTATHSHHRSAPGRSYATSAPTQKGNSTASGPCCEAKPAPRASMGCAAWQATCPTSTNKAAQKALKVVLRKKTSAGPKAQQTNLRAAADAPQLHVKFEDFPQTGNQQAQRPHHPIFHTLHAAGVHKTPDHERHYSQLEGSTPQVAPRTPGSLRLQAVQGKIPRQPTRWTHRRRAVQSGTRRTMPGVLREIQRATRPENLGVAAPQSHTKMAPQQRPTRPKGRRNGDDQLHPTAARATSATRQKHLKHTHA